MGENIKTKESTADALREQIRHTESDITATVQTLEERLSPRHLGQRSVRNAKRIAWQGAASFLDLAQKSSVQASLLSGGALLGGGALWLLLRGGKLPERSRNQKVARKPAANALHRAPRVGAATRALEATGLWMLLRKGKAQEKTSGRPSGKPAASGLALAALAAKSFLGGARSSQKSGTTQPGRKVAWRGLATAIGAALGSYWYSHKGHHA
jgi:hypothetical protein